MINRSNRTAAAGLPAILSILALLVGCMLVGCAPRDGTELGSRSEPIERAGMRGELADSAVTDEGPEEFDAIMVVKAEPKEIAPGETIELLVQVDRRADIGEVRLTLQDLPPGVILVGEQVLLRPGERVHRIMLQATTLAQGVVEAPVTIVASAEGQPEVAHIFHLTVAGPVTPSRL